VLALVVTLALSGCQADADCVLATRCSCDCCPAPEAMTKAQREAERRKCSRMGACDRSNCEVLGPCPKVKASVAICREGKCVTKAKTAAQPPSEPPSKMTTP